MVSLSFDCAKQLTVWFAVKKAFDVILFGMFCELSSKNGMHFNYISVEGTKHGSIQVASILDHYFTLECQRLGIAEVLHFYTDSCAGLKKNNFVLGYLMLRSVNGVQI